MNDFCELLRAIYINQSNEERIAAEQQRVEWMERDPLNFCLNCLQVALQPNLVRESQLAIILLFSISKHTRIITKPEVLAPFWDNFGVAIRDLLLMPSLPNDKKKLICSMIAEVIITEYALNPADSGIQKYLIDLVSAEGQYIPWVVYTISEVLEYSSDFCNFDPNFLMQNFVFNSNIDTYLRIKIYFAICYHFEQYPQCHEVFQNIIELINSDINTNFKIIHSFADKQAKFFEPHLDQFVPYLTNLILEAPNENVKILGINIINVLVDNLVYRFKKSFVLYQSVIDMLIRIISVVDDDTPWDIERGDVSLHSIARESANSISEHFDQEENLEYINQTLENITQSGDLNLMYGILTFIGEFKTLHLPKIFENILTLLGHDNQRILFAVYQALITGVKSIVLKDDTLKELLIHLFQCVKNSASDLAEVYIIRKCSLLLEITLKHANAQYNENCRTFLMENYEELRDALFEAFELTEDEETCCNLMKSIVKIVCIMDWSSIEDDYRGIIEFFQNQLTSQSVLLQVTANVSFGKLISIFDNFEQSDLCAFFENANELMNSESLIPYLMHRLLKTINFYIQKMTPELYTLCHDIISKNIELINELPPVSEVPAGDSEVISGCYIIPNAPNGIIAYVLETTIENYIDSMRLLQSAIIALKEEALPYITNIFNASMKLISHEYFIEKIHAEVFAILATIATVFKNLENLSEIINIAVDLFCNTVNEQWTIEGLDDLYSNFIQILMKSITKEGLLIGMEKIKSLVVVLQHGIDLAFNKTLDIGKSREQSGMINFYEDTYETAMERFFGGCLKLFKFISAADKSITHEMFANHYATSIVDAVRSIYIQNYAIQLLMRYLASMHDLALFETYEPVILELINKPDAELDEDGEAHTGFGNPNERYADLLMYIYKYLVKIFGKMQISDEKARNWINITFEIFDPDSAYLSAEAFFLPFDYSMSVIALLFYYHYNIVTDDDFSNFFNLMPQDTPTYYPISVLIWFCLKDPERFYINLSEEINYVTLVRLIAASFEESESFSSAQLIRLTQEIMHLAKNNPDFYRVFMTCINDANTGQISTSLFNNKDIKNLHTIQKYWTEIIKQYMQQAQTNTQ